MRSLSLYAGMTIEYFTKSISSLEWKNCAAVASSHSGFFHQRDFGANGLGSPHLRLQHEEKFVHQLAVPKAAACLVEHGGLALHVAKGRLIRPFRSQRIVNVANLQSTREQRDALPAKPIGVAAAVPVLVVMADYGQHAAQAAQWPADVLTGDRMLLDDYPLFRRQIIVFLQDRVRDGDLPQVVQIAATLEREHIV